MFFALVLMNVLHPGMVLAGNDSKFDKKTKEQKNWLRHLNIKVGFGTKKVGIGINHKHSPVKTGFVHRVLEGNPMYKSRFHRTV